MLKHISIDKEIADVAMNILQWHMWYLTPEFVPLSLFDDAVSSDEKSGIIKAIMAHQIPDVFVPGKPEFKHLWNHSDLVSIINERSWFLLQKGNVFLNVCSNEQHTYG